MRRLQWLLVLVALAALLLPAFLIHQPIRAQGPTVTPVYQLVASVNPSSCTVTHGTVNGTYVQDVAVNGGDGWTRYQAEIDCTGLAISGVRWVRVYYDLTSDWNPENYGSWQLYDAGSTLLWNDGFAGDGTNIHYDSVDMLSHAPWNSEATVSRLWVRIQSGMTGYGYYGVGSAQIRLLEFYGTYVPPTATPTLTPTPTNTPPPTQPPTGTCVSSWTKTYDFRSGTDANSWAAEIGTFSALDETGYHTMPNQNEDDSWAQSINLRTYLGGANPSDTLITSIALDITYSAGDVGLNDLRKIQVLSGSTPLINETHPVSGHRVIPWSGTAEGGPYNIVIFASGAVLTEGEANGSATIASITFSGGGYSPDGSCLPSTPSPADNSWAYPIASGDQLAHGAFQDMSLDPNGDTPQLPYTYLTESIPSGSSFDRDKVAMIGWANASGLNIHSMTDGSVTSVMPLNAGNSPCFLGLAQLGGQLVNLPSYHCNYEQTATIMALAFHDASVVTVTTGTAQISYLVNQATVGVGATVSKGCILGKTISFQTLRVAGVGVAWEASLDSYTVLQARDLSGLPFDFLAYLREEPSDIMCSAGSGGGGAGCTYVHDASFSFSGDNTWQTNGGSPEHAPGQEMGLWLKHETTQPLSLVPNKSYGITAEAHLLEPGSAIDSFTVTLGTGGPWSFSVGGITQQTFSVDPTTILAVGNGIVLSIKPTDGQGQNIIMDYICVTDADSGPPAPAGGCLVLNPDFDTQTDWTLAGSAAYRDDAPGIVLMPNGASVAQSLHLFPATGGAQDYNITVEAGAGHVFSAGQSFSLAWAWGTQSGSVGPWVDYAFLSDQDSFSVAAETTATLTLTATVTGSTDPGFLSRVCITTADGTAPPGYQPPGPPGISPNCKVCEYVPVGDINYDLSGVIAWLLCGISQIWHCQMKTILWGIWQAATNILAFLALARLWLQYTAVAFANWGNADLQVLARWLNGELNNLGQVIWSGPRTIISSDTGSNLWDVLRTLFNTVGGIISSLASTLTTAFNDVKDVLLAFLSAILTLLRVILEIAAAIINLIITVVFRIIMTILDLIKQFVDLIISVFNAPPVTPAGIPVCDDTSETVAENCMAIFMIDNTILSDQSPLWPAIPLIEGAVGFGLIWWAVQKFRNLLAGMDDQ